MPTQDEIIRYAQNLAQKMGDEGWNGGDIFEGAKLGATWANEQNAAEIAELVHALREIDEQLGDKQTLALTRILKDIVTNALKKY